ncbi:hypothetical protein EG68_11928 [Paragonimus skrjabini miyazakii]|uniref:Uncharacterized protein n=1 Tax=Paragonimus skrjabini miyazakii TaxID=59628 RepID=A0A8S9YFM5_9TREM|nr:hypothetical protein EG68_11928 [Paragonimus skrjabini miyazakii]
MHRDKGFSKTAVSNSPLYFVESIGTNGSKCMTLLKSKFRRVFLSQLDRGSSQVQETKRHWHSPQAM